MDSETVERVTGWNSEPFSGGFAGLRDLADAEFTGAVTDGMAWLFVLNGRVVGVFDGDIEAFADADGTAYTAPHPSLPLLFAMRERGGETRAKYYTEETPLEDADRTLKSGNFTGYVELSENVLSGDYYVVYQGGKSMSAAFVGNSRNLLTDEEAFERAADEVGIYEVKTVDIDVVDIPEPSTTDAAGGGVAVADDDTVDDTAAEETAAEEMTADDTTADVAAADDTASDDTTAGSPGDDEVAPDDEAGQGNDDEATDSTDDASTQDSVTFGGGAATESATNGRSASRSEPSAGDDAGTDAATDVTDETAASTTGTEDSASTEASTATGADAGESGATPTGSQRASAAGTTTGQPTDDEAKAAAEEGDDGTVFHEEAEWREARTIPALDPSESVEVDRNGSPVVEEQESEPSPDRPETTAATASKGTPPTERTSTADEGPRELKRRLAKRTDELETVREQRDELAEKRDRLAAAAEELREERDRLEADLTEERDRADRLEAKVGELESEVDRLESELATATEQLESAGVTHGERQLSPTEALAETNLFVRYRSQGGATLEDAHDGRVDREEVNENLRLEHHTGFDEEGVVVEGRPFQEFLTSTVEYGFSKWVVQDLLYDISGTGNESGLQGLYDAIPKIDRVEFDGGVTVTGDGDDSHEERFDVVLRDRMGDPLLVADVNDSRDPATESMLRSLVESATPVSERSDSLAAAFCVTTSFFEPGALETAADATGGGLLGRGKRKSFVKLSRKQGYHLCLVETRNEEFHVNVPEL